MSESFPRLDDCCVKDGVPYGGEAIIVPCSECPYSYLGSFVAGDPVRTAQIKAVLDTKRAFGGPGGWNEVS